MPEQAPIYRLISHMKEHRSTMWLATLFSILNKIFDLAPPLLIGAAVDVVARQEESVLSNGFIYCRSLLSTLLFK